MSDLLNIAQSGVRTYSRALETVADNVANASTPGHVRRTSLLSPETIGGAPSPYEHDLGTGNGVKLVGIDRAIDMLRVDTLRRADSDVSALDAGNRWLVAVEATLSGPNSLDMPMGDLFASVSDLVSDPANNAIREAFLISADTLADRFNDSMVELNQLDKNLILESEIEVQTLTDLAKGLADINAQLRRSFPGSASAISLQDERDRTLARIATIVGIDVRLDERGLADVRIPDAGGPLLVSGTNSTKARIFPAAGGLELRIGAFDNDEPATILSGTLAGLSSARKHLAFAREGLDTLAIRVATEFNQAHMQGADLTGADAKSLFHLEGAAIIPAGANGGNARLNVTLAAGAPAIPMTLTFDGTNWTLGRNDLLGSVSGNLPLALDGHSVDGAGEARPGDVFRIAPETGAAAIRLRPITASEVATSARFLSEPGQANSGMGAIELRVDAPAGIPATAPFVAAILADGSVQVSDNLGAIIGTGQPGDWIAGDGFAVRITGNPAEADSFRIVRAGPQAAGNGVAAAMLALRDAGGVAGTMGEQLDLVINNIAVQLSAGQNRADIAADNRNRAAEELSEFSGVNLNDEATDMLRFQQAYQANARIIQTARETFDAILSVMR